MPETTPENVMDLDVEPVQGFVCGNYSGWRVTTNRHAPKYEVGDILLTDKEGCVAGVVPAREQESGGGAANVSDLKGH